MTLKEERTQFEWTVTKAMLDRDKPVLGICGGEQLINVILGGTLIQHIEDEIAGHVLHEQPNPRDEPGHIVQVTPGTLLHRLTGAAELAVNSAHHQAVKDVGPAGRRQRDRAGRRDRRHRIQDPPLLPRRAVASGIPDRMAATRRCSPA